MTKRARALAVSKMLLLATVLQAPFGGGPILPVASAEAQVRAPAPPCDYYCRRRKAMERWRREELARKAGPPKPDKPGQKLK